MADEFNDNSAGRLARIAAQDGANAQPLPSIFKVVQDDAARSIELDLTQLNASIEMPIVSGQGVVAFDITGLTGSGATVVVERTVGGLWSPRNLLVVGSMAAFAGSMTVDGSATLNTVGATSIRFRVSAAGTGKATVFANATANSSLTQMATSLPPGNNRLGSMTIVDPQGVPVKFWQDTQPVSISQTVAVTGKFWQDIQPVSISGTPTVTISGTPAVSITGTPTVTIGGLPTFVQPGAANFEPTRVAVTTTTKQLVPARAGRRQLIIIPTSNFLFYVGPTAAKATAATGIPLQGPTGTVFTLDYAGEMFVTGTNNGTVAVAETF